MSTFTPAKRSFSAGSSISTAPSRRTISGISIMQVMHRATTIPFPSSSIRARICATRSLLSLIVRQRGHGACARASAIVRSSSASPSLSGMNDFRIGTPAAPPGMCYRCRTRLVLEWQRPDADVVRVVPALRARFSPVPHLFRGTFALKRETLPAFGGRFSAGFRVRDSRPCESACELQLSKATH
jgi:hypothetical protein